MSNATVTGGTGFMGLINMGRIRVTTALNYIGDNPISGRVYINIYVCGTCADDSCLCNIYELNYFSGKVFTTFFYLNA